MTTTISNEERRNIFNNVYDLHDIVWRMQIAEHVFIEEYEEGETKTYEADMAKLIELRNTLSHACDLWRQIEKEGKEKKQE